MDDLATEIRENVSEIENIPASELPQGCEWRPCRDCENLFTAPIGSKKKYCPACLDKRFAIGRSKGGRTPKKEKPEEPDAETSTPETTEKENQSMPITDKLPELHKCAVCGNDFLTTKNEPMCVQCRQEYAPAKPVETCLTGKPAYHVVVRETAPVAAEPKPTSKAAQTMRRIFDAVETVERIAAEWGVDADTVIDTITEAFGLARVVENRKARVKDGAAE